MKTTKYTKVDAKRMEVEVVEPISTVVSYEKILIDIQETEERLVYLNTLKDEADKLNLIQ